MAKRRSQTRTVDGVKYWRFNGHWEIHGEPEDYVHRKGRGLVDWLLDRFFGGDSRMPRKVLSDREMDGFAAASRGSKRSGRRRGGRSGFGGPWSTRGGW